MKIIIVAATIGEILPMTTSADSLFSPEAANRIEFAVTGVGMLAAAAQIMRIVQQRRPDLVIQAGIAGSFDNNLQLGTVVLVKNEQLASMGVREDGKWKDIFDLNIQNHSVPPFEKGKLSAPDITKFNSLNLPVVDAVTVNEISTGKERIEEIISKYHPIIESMEGAALHYVCIEEGVPFVQIRAISNYIGERSKTRWKIKEAIDNLNKTTTNLLHKIYDLK